MKRTVAAVTLACALTGCGQSQPTPEAARTPAPAATPVTETETPASPPVATIPERPYEDLLVEGDQALQAGKLNDAARLFTQAIKQAPERVEAYQRRAAAFADARQLIPAINDMSTAIQLSPDNPRLHNTRGYFCLLLKKYELADADFTRAIGLDLGYPQPYNNRGLISLARGEHEQAITDFENALRVDPRYVDALNNRGFAQVQLNRLEPAVESFTRALEQDGNYINARTNRARALLKLNRSAEALDDLNRVIELQPNHLSHYTLRAEAHLACGQESAANADLQHVSWVNSLTELNQKLRRSPRDADLWNNMGRHLLTRNRDAEARQAFEQGIQANGQHLSCLMGLALVCQRAGQPEQVVDTCTRVITASGSLEAYSMRGDAYVQLGQFDQAIADYDIAKRFDSGVASTHRRRAEIRRQSGDLTGASADEAFAERFEKSLSEKTAPVKGTPRAMVVEQAGYEEPASPR